MGITSLQVCMDSSNWLQGPIPEENTGMMDSSPVTTPNGHDDILTCSQPLIERRLRPQHEQAMKCPRCESTHTKFCYYNNYSLSQPRYFCKTCRRYWTKGGTLRNIPVGGGFRKNKKVSSNPKKPSTSSSTSSLDQINLHRQSASSFSSPLTLDHSNFTDMSSSQYHNRNNTQTTDLLLAFPEQLQFSSIHGAGLINPANTGLLFEDVITPTPIEYMGNKYDGFMGDNIGGGMNMGMQNPNNFHGNMYSYHHPHHPFGLSSLDHGMDNNNLRGGANILERLMLPYDENNHHHHHHQNYMEQNNHHEVDVKPNAKILSLEWHDCNSDVKDSLGYNLGGLGSWTGLMNGYGPSATNPLV